MRIVAGIGRGALAKIFALHKSSFRVPADWWLHDGGNIMSTRFRDVTSPWVIYVALASPPRPRLLSCLGSGRRSPCS
jgi:hypothetical protein